jgi:hypothetical protein
VKQDEITGEELASLSSEQFSGWIRAEQIETVFKLCRRTIF